MSPLHNDEFEARVRALRAATFDLLDELGPSLHGPASGTDVTLAAVRLQNVANELGVIEDLVGRDRQRPAAA